MILGGTVETKHATTADLGAGESARTERIIEPADLEEPSIESLLITARDVWVEAAARAAASDAAGRLSRLPHVAGVGDVVPSPQADALMVPVTLADDRVNGTAQVVPVLAEVSAIDADHPGVRVELVGGASITHGLDELIAEDLAGAGMLSLLALPALGMSLRTAGDNLPRSIPVMQSYDRLVATYPSQGNIHRVVVQAGAQQGDAVHRALTDLAARAQGSRLFAVDDVPTIRTSSDGFRAG